MTNSPHSLPTRTHIVIIGGTAALLALDYLTKWLATNFLVSPFEVIPDLFTLTLAQNTGVAWSIEISQALLLFGIPVFLLIAGKLALLYLDFQKKTTQLLVILTLAGALGNYIDRLRFGYVIDFISIGWWPIFNLADIYITCGAFILLLFHARIERNSKQK